jgi:hypothetical protein
LYWEKKLAPARLARAPPGLIDIDRKGAFLCGRQTRPRSA